MKKAIKKAIDGGWRPRGVAIHEWSSFESMVSLIPWQEIVSDPNFWKCLGKAEGWKGDKIRMCCGCGIALRMNEQPTMDGKHGGKKGCGSDIMEYEGQWLIEWHRFIDHIADGGDIDTFFNNLIK